MNKGLFTSKTDEWETPQDLFNSLSLEFGGFGTDVCATKENTKVLHYFSREQDGLKQDWSDLDCWMNPPYGREIGEWVKKASEGGGETSSGASSGPNRYEMVSRLHLQ